MMPCGMCHNLATVGRSGWKKVSWERVDLAIVIGTYLLLWLEEGLMGENGPGYSYRYLFTAVAGRMSHGRELTWL